MDINEANRILQERMNLAKQFIEGNDIKDIMGVEAVNHFKKSFDQEGFTDKSLIKWKEVKRRKTESAWYGHSGQTGKFSEARTKAKILHGETKELKESISYVRTPIGARVTNDTPYASVHQFGQKAKIYGKKEFTMTARPFMGKSMILKIAIERKIKNRLKQLMK